MLAYWKGRAQAELGQTARAILPELVKMQDLLRQILDRHRRVDISPHLDVETYALDIPKDLRRLDIPHRDCRSRVTLPVQEQLRT